MIKPIKWYLGIFKDNKNKKMHFNGFKMKSKWKLSSVGNTSYPNQVRELFLIEITIYT